MKILPINTNTTNTTKRSILNHLKFVVFEICSITDRREVHGQEIKRNKKFI